MIRAMHCRLCGRFMADDVIDQVKPETTSREDKLWKAYYCRACEETEIRPHTSAQSRVDAPRNDRRDIGSNSNNLTI